MIFYDKHTCNYFRMQTFADLRCENIRFKVCCWDDCVDKILKSADGDDAVFVRKMNYFPNNATLVLWSELITASLRRGRRPNKDGMTWEC